MYESGTIKTPRTSHSEHRSPRTRFLICCAMRADLFLDVTAYEFNKWASSAEALHFLSRDVADNGMLRIACCSQLATEFLDRIELKDIQSSADARSPAAAKALPHGTKLKWNSVLEFDKDMRQRREILNAFVLAMVAKREKIQSFESAGAVVIDALFDRLLVEPELLPPDFRRLIASEHGISRFRSLLLSL